MFLLNLFYIEPFLILRLFQLLSYDFIHHILHYMLLMLDMSHLLYLPSTYSLLMLMYSLHIFIVSHLHLNNLPLLLVFLHLLSNYYLLKVSSSLLLLLLHLPLLNVHFHHMSILLFTMLLLAISSLYYNLMSYSLFHH